MNFLDLVDDYEEEAYGFYYNLQICEHEDCREPRRGPFVEQPEGAYYCIRCHLIYVEGYEPDDVID